MNKASKSPKVIADPIYGIIDIRPVLANGGNRGVPDLGRQTPARHVISHVPVRNAQPQSSFFGLISRNARAREPLAQARVHKRHAGRRSGRIRALPRHRTPGLFPCDGNLCAQPKGTSGMSVNSALSFKFIQKLKKNIAGLRH